ncbi:MAG TPA: bifunctional serine/threonine-protein kinase/formylglycine-generating enzyme family protein [Candidatus Syntrophosphaera sp.]|nr:bifunctional serine/threonine-protein kinase/formylglycine-generating enzyme family protein [Candidatus Syntrophosphaera sp.]
MLDNRGENAYTILETLHQSRRFKVYKAKNYFSGNLVCIKTNTQRWQKDSLLVQQMRGEVETGLKLQHPHIRKTLGIFKDDAAVFMVSEFVEGVSLEDLLSTPKLDISYDHALKWTLQMLDALDYAHGQQAVHLNLNPSNILITPNHDLILIGFGKSPSDWKFSEAENDRLHPMLFTPPELFLGRETDQRADLYSVGVISYLLFCGQLPWSLDTKDTPSLRKQQTFQRPVIDTALLGLHLPHWLFTVLNKSLMLDPSKRFETAGVMHNAFLKEEAIPYESCLTRSILEAPKDSVILEFPPELAEDKEVVELVPDIVAGSELGSTAQPGKGETVISSGGLSGPQLEIPGLETPAPAAPTVAEDRIAPQSTTFSPIAPKPYAATSAGATTVRPDAAKPAAAVKPAPKPASPEEREEMTRLRKLWSILKLVSLGIVVYILFKYVIIRDRPKFSKPDESTGIAEVTQEFAEKNEPLEMIPVAGAKVIIGYMGPDAEDDEFPPRELDLASYMISSHEVTRSEWAMATPGYVVESGEGDLPITNVTFYDVLEFCNQKSIKDGLKPCYEFLGDQVSCDFSLNGYRLPTEAEWEYAARGAKRDNFNTYSGSPDPDKAGWYSGNSDGRIRKVGKKEPNELGLYDMSGNAAEWVWNWYARYSSALEKNPAAPDYGTDKVVRGGSWNQDAKAMRVTNRDSAKPLIQKDFIGFRVVRSK